MSSNSAVFCYCTAICNLAAPVSLKLAEVPPSSLSGMGQINSHMYAEQDPPNVSNDHADELSYHYAPLTP